MSKVITIIPARGGSKGVPRKNIKSLNGKPLIAYAIEAALKSGVIDRVIVSTEDKEIAEVAKQYGAEVINRPEDLAGDKVTLDPVIKQALEFLETQENYIPDFVSCIQPTSPLLKSEIVKACVGKVVDEGFDSCIAAFEPEFPVMQRVVRQDLPKVYHENGAFYITKLSLFKKIGHRWGGKMAVVEMSEEDSIHIDNLN